MGETFMGRKVKRNSPPDWEKSNEYEEWGNPFMGSYKGEQKRVGREFVRPPQLKPPGPAREGWEWVYDTAAEKYYQVPQRKR